MKENFQVISMNTITVRLMLLGKWGNSESDGAEVKLIKL